VFSFASFQAGYSFLSFWRATAIVKVQRYTEQDLVLAWRHPFLASFWAVHPPLPKVHRNHDVICETDHLDVAP
jgi:hypothetical protein